MVLQSLVDLDQEPPFNFRLEGENNKVVFAGVLDFDGPEDDKVRIPEWMAKYLENTTTLSFTKVPKGKMIKVQPQHPDFLKIPDVKETLETIFRDYPILTKGTIIEFLYADHIYELLIEDTHSDDPNDGGSEVSAISLIDTDLEVDFSTPKGYVELPQPKKMDISEYIIPQKVKIFPGKTLGKKPIVPVVPDVSGDEPRALHLPPGMLYFGYSSSEMFQKK